MHNPRGTGHFTGRLQDQLGGLNGKVRRTSQYIANTKTVESSKLTATLVYYEALIGFVGEVLAKVLVTT